MDKWKEIEKKIINSMYEGMNWTNNRKLAAA